jgi:cytoskeletal protein RodZ
MSDDNGRKEALSSASSEGGKRGRKKQKIRIKYRQRVKIRKRPKGYKLKRFWKKYSKNLIAYVIILVLLGGTAIMVMQVVKQQIERNKMEKNQRL